jgi:AcrR family transcriptional regulator
MESRRPHSQTAREPGEPRRSRDRAATERRILEATWRLFDRGGPLAGINLQEVADEAGVNRSLVYQYFGSREELVRKALAARLDLSRPLFGASASLPFAERRRRGFSILLVDPTPTRLTAQLALADDPDVKVLPMIDGARMLLTRDLQDGSLPPDADAVVMHAMTTVLAIGYAVLREQLAAELEIDLQELDHRATLVYGLIVDGLAAGGGRRPKAEAPRPVPSRKVRKPSATARDRRHTKQAAARKGDR